MGHMPTDIQMPPSIKITGMTVRDETLKSLNVLCGYFDARFADILDVRGFQLFFDGQVFRVSPPKKIDDNRHVHVPSEAGARAIAEAAVQAYHILGGQYGR